MNQRIRKSPSQYPMFAVRLTDEQKDKLYRLIEGTRDALNKVIDENETLWMKNDVVFEALLLGLPLLKRKAKRKG